MSENKTSLGMGENLEGALCYFLLFVSGIIFLLIEKDNKFVRFHAMQSVLLFIPLAIVGFIVGMVPLIGWLAGWAISVVTFGLWLFLMYKAFNNELYKVPIIGDIAEKQINR
ncbi:MAG: hypothetical protein DDT22_01272 [candidate division WS2 bacterium]|nr:hypothetical protein [Candidatus Lithacetigena glycinireducens]MBT9175592.1 hypothetical protein [Candidatus Lithacetigena glycinireducens]